MAVGKKQEGKMSPVHFFSHGSTMMLGEDSASARYWERMGEEALKNGVEHVVMMVRLNPIFMVTPFLTRAFLSSPSFFCCLL